MQQRISVPHHLAPLRNAPSRENWAIWGNSHRTSPKLHHSSWCYQPPEGLSVPCRGGTWMHPLDRKSTGTAVPFLTKSLTSNSASRNVSGGLRKSKIKLIMYKFSPNTLPVSNYFQLRGFPESNVVCLFILLLPPNVFLFQVLIHSGETDFKQTQVSMASTPKFRGWRKLLQWKRIG